MKLIPRVVDVAMETIQNPPRTILDTAILQNRGAIQFYEKGVFELAGPRPPEEMVLAAGPIVEALRRYQDFLEKVVLPRSTQGWRLGKEKFAKKMELVLDSQWDADRVLEEAEREFTRVQRDMYVVSRQLWSRYYPNRSLPPDDEAGRRTAIAEVVKSVSQEHGQRRPWSWTRDRRSERFKNSFAKRTSFDSPKSIGVRLSKCQNFVAAIRSPISIRPCLSIRMVPAITP